MVFAHGGLIVFERHDARQFRNGIGGKHVVHHVGARMPRVHAAAIDIEHEAVFLKAHIRRRERELGTRPSAIGTTIGAELPIVHVVVFQRAAALLAEAAVGNAVGGKAHVACDAERERFIGNAVGDGRAQGIVAVEHERGFGRFRERFGDGGLNAVDFAKAVELIAEQVQQHEIMRTKAGQHILGIHLVAFKAAHGRLRGACRVNDLRRVGREHERRHDARLQIVSLAIAIQRRACSLQAVGNEVRGGGFAVRTRNHGHGIHLFRQVNQNRWINLKRHSARDISRRAMHERLAAPSGRPAQSHGSRRTNSHICHLTNIATTRKGHAAPFALRHSIIGANASPADLLNAQSI